MQIQIQWLVATAVLFFSYTLSADDTAPTEGKVEGDAPPKVSKDDTEKPYKIKPLALVHAKYEWEHENDVHDYDLNRARIGLRASYVKFVQGKVSFDARSDDILKSGWLRLRFMRELRLKIGLFKRPFLKIRMRSPHDIETISRGNIDRILKYGMDYSAHKTGASLEGRFFEKVRLKYKVGLFPDFAASRGIVGSNDLVAMLSVKPVKKFEIGAAGEVKFLTSDEAHADRAMAANLFLDVDLKGWYSLVEGVIGQDPRYSGTPLFLGVLGMVSYTFNFMSTKPLDGLRPVVKVEVMDPDTEIRKDLSIRGTAGIDLLFVYNVRIGVNAEYLYADSNSREGEENSFLLLALAGWEL